MKGLCTLIGAVVVITIGSPVFVWLGTKFFLGYGTYANWVYNTLSAIGR
jgi:hypothetical protein